MARELLRGQNKQYFNAANSLSTVPSMCPLPTVKCRPIQRHK